MAAIYSNGDNHWNILGNFTKRDALSSVYKISMTMSPIVQQMYLHIMHLSLFEPN